MEWLDVGVGCCRDWMDVGVGGGEEEDVGLGGRKGNDDVQMEVVWLNKDLAARNVVRLLSSLGHVVLSSMLKKKGLRYSG